MTGSSQGHSGTRLVSSASVMGDSTVRFPFFSLNSVLNMEWRADCFVSIKTLSRATFRYGFLLRDQVSNLPLGARRLLPGVMPGSITPAKFWQPGVRLAFDGIGDQAAEDRGELEAVAVIAGSYGET